MTTKKILVIAGLAALVLCLGIATLGASSSQGGAQDAQNDKFATTRAALEKLSTTRQLISKEKRDWMLKKQTIQERMELIRGQIADLEKKIEASKGKIADADKQKAELTSKLEKLDAGVASLKDAVPELEKRTQSLAKRLPAPILERIKALVEALPKDPKETKLNLTQRYSFVTGILDQVNKFHREITTVPERREVPGGEVEVTTVYFGCGQAFYAKAKGDVAGVGTASPEGWIWVPQNEHADAIRKMIAIVQGQKGAEYVPVPVRIQ